MVEASRAVSGRARGEKFGEDDRLGKTIIFAKNEKHAKYIAERFDVTYPHLTYPHLKGQIARVVTFQTEYAQSLIDDFSQKDKAPHIAISVDMLDTGIDVPEVVNLGNGLAKHVACRSEGGARYLPLIRDRQAGSDTESRRSVSVASHANPGVRG